MVAAIEVPLSAGAGAACARKLRVLVVDGNQDCADSLQILLTLSGFEVQQARTGAVALRLAESFRPDVAIVDLVLPEINGLVLAQRLRELPGLDRLLLIALTGLGDAAYRHKAREAGFAHHWLKPVDPELLLETLSRFGDPRRG
jgi:DNA-binding response OmpR family regulator